MGGPMWHVCKRKRLHQQPRKRYNHSSRRRQQGRHRAHRPAANLRAAHIRQNTLRQLARERGRQGDHNAPAHHTPPPPHHPLTAAHTRSRMHRHTRDERARRGPQAPKGLLKTALTHELNKLRFASLRRSFGTLGHAPAFPGAETLPQAMARHRSQTGKGAMSWVTARPASPALTISPPACKLALRRALGIEAHHGARCPFASSCQTQAPADERHARHCRAMGYSYIHDRVRDDLAAILTSYGVVHRREDPTPFANGRVDLSTLAGALPLSGNRRLLQRGALLDVTVVDPLVHIRHRASTTDGAAAAFAHTRKLQKYRGASLRFDHATYTLWPLALESYGRWGDTAEEFIDALATHAIGGADSASWRAKGAIVHGIRQRLAVTLQRATSAHVMRYAQRRLELERASGGTVPVADHLVA